MSFPASVLRLTALLTATLVAASACGDSDEERIRAANLAEGCSINSDCKSPLVCAFERCHVQCQETRDCPLGSRCVRTDGDYGVCLLEDETTCSAASDCPGKLVCAVDHECRDSCLRTSECVSPQLCVDTTCAEEGEVDPNGHLPGWGTSSGGTSGQGGGGAGGGAAQGGTGAAGQGGTAGQGGGAGGQGGTAGNGTGGSGASGGVSAGGTSSDAGIDASTGGSGGSGGTPFDAGATLPEPVSYWPLEQIGGGAPDAVGNHHAHFSGSPTPTTGKLGNGVEFNVTGAVDQRVEIYTSNDMKPLTTLAVSVWFKSAIPLNSSVRAPFMSRRDNFHLGYATGALVFDVTDISNVTTAASYTVDLGANQWHHAAASYDANGDNKLHLYLDGAEVATADGTGSINKNAIEATYLAFHSVYVYADYMLGSLDEAAYYTQPLTASDAAALYAAGNAGHPATTCSSCPSAVGYWPLDTDPDPSVPDVTGPNPGTVVNGPPSVPGKVNNALLMHNGQDRITFANSITLNPGRAMTLAMWVKPSTDVSTSSPYHQFFNKDYSYRLAGGGGPLLFEIAGGQASTSTTLWKDTWYHLAGTWDDAAKEIRLYVDGALVSQKTLTGSASSSGNIANVSRADAAFGAADEIVLYDVALSDEQVAALYNYGTAGLPIPHL